MFRNCFGRSRTLAIVAFAVLVLPAVVLAEIRKKPAATDPKKSTPGQSTTAPKSDSAGLEQGRTNLDAGQEARSGPSASDKPAVGKSNGTEANEKVKKKTDPKNARDSKPPVSKKSVGKKSPRPRKNDDPPPQQVLTGVDLNLEPET